MLGQCVDSGEFAQRNQPERFAGVSICPTVTERRYIGDRSRGEALFDQIAVLDDLELRR